MQRYYRTVSKFPVRLQSCLYKCLDGQKFRADGGGGKKSSRLTFTILVALMVHARIKATQRQASDSIYMFSYRTRALLVVIMVLSGGN